MKEFSEIYNWRSKVVSYRKTTQQNKENTLYS